MNIANALRNGMKRKFEECLFCNEDKPKKHDTKFKTKNKDINENKHFKNQN